jgi:hypothetical protein
VSSPTSSEIDALALSIERLIAQNDAVLDEYDDERSVADAEDSTSSSSGTMELFE